MKQKDFLFSIIIPCYNSYKYMDKCFKSLESQKFKNFEVIIIDDNSSDDSYANIIKYINCSSIENIKIIKNNVNIGAGESRNKGIVESNGKYILFIDSDDYISEDCLKILNEIIINNKDIDCICFDYFIEKEGKKYKKSIIENIENIEYLNIKEVLIKIKGSTWGKVYKSELIKNNNIKFLGLKRNEDMPFTKTAISYCKNVYYYSTPLYYYCMNEDSLMHNKKLLNEENSINAIKELKEKINQDYKEEMEVIYIHECIYSVVCTMIYKKYSYKTINKKVNELSKEYPEWKKNKKIRLLPMTKRIIIFFIKIKMFFIISGILKIKGVIS